MVWDSKKKPTIYNSRSEAYRMLYNSKEKKSIKFYLQNIVCYRIASLQAGVNVKIHNRL